MSKPVIGLTGGIACGKSTVARLLVERGAACVDADQLARDVVAKGSDGLAAIVAAFGPEVLTETGELDRKKLGAVVFADAEKRKLLEGITHPRIALEGMKRIAELGSGPAPYVLYEAALLVETGRHTTFPALVVVTVSPEVQRERLIGREGLTPEEAEARIASQMPLSAKEAVATFIVRNDGSLDALRAEVDLLHDAILARFAGGAPRS